MRIPLLLTILVVLATPADVHSLADNVTAQFRSASAAITDMLRHEDQPQRTVIAAR